MTIQPYLISRAYSLNNKIKYNSQHCEMTTLSWLVEDATATLIDKSCKQREEQGYIPIIGFALNSNVYMVNENSKTAVKILYSPVDTTARKLKYETSDPEVFTVSSTGVIVGNSAGTATLTVTSVVNENIKATAEVQVIKENDLETTTYSLGALSNVDVNVDDAPDGSILVKNGDTYVSDIYTDTVILDMSSDAKDLWQAVVSTYPSVYMVTLPDLLDSYSAEVTKTDSQIRIKYLMGLRNYVVDLTKIDGVIYKNEYYSEYLE